eukprot:5241927-Amphidinium_carterae.1
MCPSVSPASRLSLGRGPFCQALATCSISVKFCLEHSLQVATLESRFSNTVQHSSRSNLALLHTLISIDGRAYMFVSKQRSVVVEAEKTCNHIMTYIRAFLKPVAVESMLSQSMEACVILLQLHERY